MTALNPEAKPTENQNQIKAEANSPQQNVESNAPKKQPDVADHAKQEAKEPETPEDPNWKAFREARKKDRAEKEAAERRAAEKENEIAALKAAMDAAFSAKSSPSPQAYQQFYGMNQPPEQGEETEEQRIERKVNELLEKKENHYKQQRAEEEKQLYPKRLMKDFPDFTQVCSQENLDYLDFHYPELSRPLQRLEDGYDKWHDTYHAVKKFIPNHSTAKKEAARADLNSNKPRSISSTGPSPTGEPVREGFQDTEARRAANWQRMQRVLKGV
jgi:hypothetical protein